MVAVLDVDVVDVADVFDVGVVDVMLLTCFV